MDVDEAVHMQDGIVPSLGDQPRLDKYASKAEDLPPHIGKENALTFDLEYWHRL